MSGAHWSRSAEAAMSVSSSTSGPDVTGSGAPLADATIATLVVLGASGDLANRLLMPALGKLLHAEPHRRGLVLLGAGAEALEDQSWKDQVTASLGSAQVSGETIEALLSA